MEGGITEMKFLGHVTEHPQKDQIRNAVFKNELNIFNN
jgi:hypothetical protein